MTFSFLHAADLHLDTPFTSVGGYPERVGAALREASLEAWEALVQTALDRRVAFVVLAGDIYDGAERGIRAQRAFLDGVSRLADGGIRTFLVHGNHDPVREGWTAITTFPEAVHRFSETEVESVELTVGGEQVVIHGTSYATSATTDNLVLRFPTATPRAFNIGLLHANLGGLGSKHQDYSPCTVDDLRRTGYQYWALGHIHQRQTPHEHTPWVVYPGNIQGRNPRSSERGAKGAVIVSVTNGEAAPPEFVPLDRVRFVDVAVDIAPLADTAALLDRLEAAADPANHGGRGVLVRATVEGSGRLHQELLAPGRREEVLQELRDRGAGATPFVWWERLTWRTRSAVDVIDIRRREDFAADLVRYMDETTPAFAGAWASELPSDLVRELGSLLPDPQDPGIWETAQRIALGVGHGGRPMRIHGWHIDGFGVHHDLQVTDLPPGLTVVTGPNESGKSTLQHFLTGVLFGFPNKGRPDRHEPVDGGNYGGRLFVTDEDGRAIVIHRGARKSSLRLATADGDLEPAELADLLGGASKDLFQSVFAVHLSELAELKALTADQVRERVFSAGIVGAGRTAEAALKDLGEKRDMLLRPSGRGAFLLKSLRDDLVAARGRLADARVEAERLPDLLDQLAHLDAEAASLRRDARATDQEREVLLAVQQVWPAWVAAQDARRQLAELGPVPAWDPAMVTSLRHAVTRRAERSAALGAASRKLDEATQRATALPLPGPALAHAPSIDRLAQQAQAELQRQDRITELGHRLATHRSEVDAALDRLGPARDRTWLTARAPQVEAAAELRTLADATEQAGRTADAALATHRALAEELADAGEELRATAAQAAATTGPSAESAARYLDATARLVALLGQREAAVRHLTAAQQRADHAASASSSSHRGAGRPVAVAGGLVLVAGLALIASGAVPVGVACLAIGGALLAIAALVLGLGHTQAEPTATEDLLTAHATDELAQVDAELAPVLDTLDLAERPTASQAAEIQSHAHRLAAQAHDRAAAKRHTADLVEAQQRTASRRLAASEAEVARTTADRTAADARWAAWLAEHHLPASLSPSGAVEFLATVDHARAAERTAHQVERDLQAAQDQSRAFAQDVATIATELGLDTHGTDPLVLVEQLAQAAAAAVARAQAIEAATGLVEHRRLDREQAIAERDQADADLKVLLGEAAVADADHALEQIERVEHARSLRRTIADADTRLAAALGEADPQIRRAHDLLTDPEAEPTAWARRIEQLDLAAHAAHGRRDEVLDHRSRLQSQVDALTRSADIPMLELQVSDLESQLVGAVSDWAAYHLAHQMVEGTLARYQRERQPEVVQRAAALFAQVTGGRYTRLEVRGTDVIAIDRSAREVPAADLSQGTTEQLYLCMRFALAESFAKTAPLPILLDDITVNADVDRLPRLAQMIATVAETQQVLVFSCQDRMVELLQQADPQARVITLPASGTAAARIGAVS